MKKFLVNTKNQERDSVIWNMMGSILMAFQSVIFLMILTRTVGLVDAGIFTIANVNANLFLVIGKYGIRNYQVSDVKNDFSFREYLAARWITSIFMIVVSIVFVIYTTFVNGYSIEKSQIVLWMCLFKVPDALEDVYYGDYQKKNRLDVASKALTLRIFLTIIFFAVVVIITRNLLFTLILSTIFTTTLMIIVINNTKSLFKEEIETDFKKLGTILKVCFPVFMSGFLSFYIGNAPKYAIDAQLSDELQACYGFLSMPVFVIGLLNGFVFNPILYRLSCLWNDNKIKEFIRNVLIQVGVVFIITIVCIVGANILGIPVLSWMYNTDLSPYKAELLILLLGGGLFGLSGMLCSVITIMRHQNAILYSFVIVAILAVLFSNEVVQRYQILGATVWYTALMLMLCICFVVIFTVGIKKVMRKNNY